MTITKNILIVLSVLFFIFSTTEVFASDTHKYSKEEQYKIAKDICAMKSQTILSRIQTSIQKPDMKLLDAIPSIYNETGYGKPAGDYYRTVRKGSKRYFKSYKYLNSYNVVEYINWKYRINKNEEIQLTKAINRIVKKKKLKSNKKTKKQKLLIINKYICNRVTYDESEIDSYGSTAYGALFHGGAVCEGYSSLFYRLARASGIPCRIICGKAGNIDHAWNIVKYKGKWYGIDCTWNDTNVNKTRYFLKGSTTFHKTHYPGPECRTKSFKRKFPMSKKSIFH